MLSLPEETTGWPRAKTWDSDLMWKPVEAADRIDLIAQIDPIDERYAIDDDAEVRTAALSFYDPETVQIVRIQSPAWNHKSLSVYFLRHEDSLYRLNGTSLPIHEANNKFKIVLNGDNVLSYLRFFCFFVRGPEGPFVVTESLEQSEIPSALTEAERADLLKVVRPACFNGYDEEKAEFWVMAPIYYSNAISVADFIIQKTGMVEMITDRPALVDLSAKVSMPLA